MKYTKMALVSVIFATGFGVATHYLQSEEALKLTPIEENIPDASVISREAIIRTLSNEGQIIGLTGDIDKRARVTDDK